MPDISELRFTLDPDLIAWEDFDALDEVVEGLKSRGGFRKLRPTIAGYMVNEEGQIMERAEAMAILGKLKVSQINAVLEALMAAKRKAVDDAVPPTLPGS